MNDNIYPNPHWKFFDKDDNLIVEFDAINDIIRAIRLFSLLDSLKYVITGNNLPGKDCTIKYLEEDKEAINRALIILKHTGKYPEIISRERAIARTLNGYYPLN
jgi:hypothetical protein